MPDSPFASSVSIRRFTEPFDLSPFDDKPLLALADEYNALYLFIEYLVNSAGAKSGFSARNSISCCLCHVKNVGFGLCLIGEK